MKREEYEYFAVLYLHNIDMHAIIYKIASKYKHRPKIT